VRGIADEAAKKEAMDKFFATGREYERGRKGDGAGEKETEMEHTHTHTHKHVLCFRGVT
jgi:hypothetical protein